ncbi:hypothetical protein BH23CHL1_BH23CHL1_13460 [soil metagenome]
MTHLLRRYWILPGAAILMLLALVATLGATVLNARAENEGHGNDPEIIPAEAEVFVAGNSFPDEFRAEYRLKFGESDDTGQGKSGDARPKDKSARETFERLVNDGSNVFMGRLTFAAEADGKVGGVDWHTHPGPFLVAVTEGALTVTWEDECAPQTYEAGEAFVDLGQRMHKAENFADGETVVHFTVIGVPEGVPITHVAAHDEGFEEPCAGAN